MTPAVPAAGAGDGATAPAPVFVSYASEDVAVATRIRAGLEQAGLPCWIAPRDIQPGSSFPAAITAAIASCRALVLLLTRSANASPHVLSEVELAFNARKPIVAVLVGGVTPSADLQYFISTTHWFDAESSFDDEDLARLRVDLERLLAGGRGGRGREAESDRERDPARARERGRRRAVRGTIAAVVLVALIGGVGYVIWGRSSVTPVPAGTPAVSRQLERDSPAPGAESRRPAADAPPAAGPPAATPSSPAVSSAPATSPSPVPRSRVNPRDGQTYMWVPPGRYSMGCSAGDPVCQPDEMPAHAVRIAAGFWLARTEVTAARYARAGAAASSARAGDDMPASGVTRAEAKGYCASIGGRLPTEAEWEYAARGGTTERYYDSLASIAWYEGNSDGRAHRVAGKSPNAFGLYDMLGNVYEWVLDRYYNQYDDTDTGVEEPIAPNASGVARGGAWTSAASDVRVTNRLALPPDAAEPNVGFRCVLAGR